MKFLKSFAIILIMFAAITSFAQVTKLRDLVGTGTNGRISGDNLGGAVAVSGDIIAVGANGQDYDSAGANMLNDAGAVYIFRQDKGGINNWGLEMKLTVSSSSGRHTGARFGMSVAISGDILVVGAIGESWDTAGGGYVAGSGAAYIYDRNYTGTNNWGFRKKLIAGGVNGRGTSDAFGTAVTISGNYIVVGAPYHDYDSAGGNYIEDAGAAYIYYKDSGGTDNWGQVKKLAGAGTNGRTPIDYFGASVAISSDEIVVGAPGHRYDSTGGNIVFGAGAAYVFYKNSGGTGNWGLAKKLTGKGNNGRVEWDYFGTCVAISGNDIVVSAPQQHYDSIGGDSLYRAGAAYIFYKNSGGTDNWGIVKKITGVGTNGRRKNDLFGGSPICCSVIIENSVAISGDDIIIGVSGQSYNSTGGDSLWLYPGAAYIFNRNYGATNNWGFVQKITGTGTNGRKGYDYFGISVAIDGDILVAGIPFQAYDTAGGNNLYGAGKATIFVAVDLEYSGGVWLPYAPSSSTASKTAYIADGSPALDSGVQVKNFTISSGATPSISQGTFTVSGDYTNYGTLSGAGSITLGGSSAQTIYGNGTTNNLVLNNLAGTTISSTTGDSLIITGVVTHTAGTLTTNNKLRLKATGAVAYAQIAGTGSGTISGNVIAEYQVLTADTVWKPVCSPLNDITLSQLADDVYLNYGIPAPEYATIYTFNESRSPSWQPPASGTSMDDSCFSVFMWTVPVYLDITGTYGGTADYTLNNLSYTGGVSDTSGWHYIRNPWPSGFLWDGSISNIQGNQVYVYDQNGGSGGFYRVFDNLSNGVVPPFNPLLVQVTSNNVSVTLPNSKRNTDSLGNYMDKTFPAVNYVELGIQKEGQPITDYVKFYTDDAAKNTFDALDGIKKLNTPSMPNMYFSMGTDKLNKQVYNNIPDGTTKLPLVFLTTVNGKYIINPYIENLAADVEVFLEDLRNNTLLPINTAPITINYTGNGVANRYNLVFVKKSTNNGVQSSDAAQKIIISQAEKTLFINGYVPANTIITVTDILGRVLVQQTMQDSAQGITQIGLNQLTIGYYIINLSGPAISYSQKIIIK